jgi:hypothetical protein
MLGDAATLGIAGVAKGLVKALDKGVDAAKAGTQVGRLKPGQRLGGAGKPISPTVKHGTRKKALDAAQAETARGRAPQHHRAEKGNPPHYHAVDSSGEFKPTHHDYPKR